MTFTIHFPLPSISQLILRLRLRFVAIPLFQKAYNRYTNLDVYKVLNAPARNTALDMFRAIAIIAVVLYHFHHFLKNGNLGVDLFFVISGLLVGGILTRDFDKKKVINIPKFLLQRGFKIWPSYYSFLIIGTILAYIFYRNTHFEQIIPWEHSGRYLFFYQNYVDFPVHWSFDHVWSLCVEEHFYIMLPLVFFFVHRVAADKYRTHALFFFVVLAIVAGIVFKYLSYHYTASKDTYTGTHNRIDALAWGVLLNLVIFHFGEKLKTMRYLWVLSVIGLSVFIAIVYIGNHTTSGVYHQIILRSIIPPCFFLLILGAYFLDFKRFFLIRMAGYYSYNWYLWHPIFVSVISDNISVGRLGLSVYVLASFSMSVLATVLIEEPFLRLRKKVIPLIFKPKTTLAE